MTVDKFVEQNRPYGTIQECIEAYATMRYEELLSEILESDYFRAYGEDNRCDIVGMIGAGMQNTYSNAFGYYSALLHAGVQLAK